MKNTLVVNMIGSPGTGKSTMAAHIFAKLKFKGIDAELVSEFAKELVWEQRHETFKDEVYLFAKQNHRIFRVNGKVDVIVTDRPVILSTLYNRLYGSGSGTFEDFVVEESNRYNNLNILLKRVKPYNPNGRNQTEEESNQMTLEIEKILNDHSVEYTEIPAEEKYTDYIMRLIEEKLKEDN